MWTVISSLFFSSWSTEMAEKNVVTPMGRKAKATSIASRVLRMASIRASSASSGCMPSCSMRTVSIAARQKSPIFCWSVPGWAALCAALSLIERRFR